ncbi:hypothetical protein P7K49_017483 [Saguinus oedipus]|uniref:Uncharacterized protein n=1 Tax=Saguinus oedipus TaxID=9490 RepID=A0ABQ9V5B4_SAGOE|nr:hypothetical protein P7K49_017483 [Saguinus oedipus]
MPPLSGGCLLSAATHATSYYPRIPAPLLLAQIPSNLILSAVRLRSSILLQDSHFLTQTPPHTYLLSHRPPPRSSPRTAPGHEYRPPISTPLAFARPRLRRLTLPALTLRPLHWASSQSRAHPERTPALGTHRAHSTAPTPSVTAPSPNHSPTAPGPHSPASLRSRSRTCRQRHLTAAQSKRDFFAVPPIDGGRAPATESGCVGRRFCAEERDL